VNLAQQHQASTSLGRTHAPTVRDPTAQREAALTQSIPTHPVHSPTQPEPPQESARDRLIVALDLSSPDESRSLVERLGAAVSFYKLGWGLLLRPGGTEFLEDLLRAGKQIFLDLKFFDVPNSVGVAVSAATALGVRFTTVHGNHEIIKAAVQARGDSALQILAVTVLTSLSELETRRMYGMPDNVTLEDHVVEVARNLVESGCDGVIASPWEVAAIRRNVPRQVVVATPGIRMSGESLDDQKRTGTPYDSILAGADYLVVGRSVYQNADPVSQVEKYVEEIQKGLADRTK
jgi:orotidine-5'-phosphate decarboxylase